MNLACCQMTCSENVSSHKNIWKGKIPAKIKFFMWMVVNNAILTKDNMIIRNWKGSPLCYFCDQMKICYVFYSVVV
jgi:hypothetical protein